jgi:2-succinyl-5-enolpyruvyl-6-hydroxy-3-cyclohexene-1-carboxylate synthase
LTETTTDPAAHPNPSTALARVVADELAARGVRVVVISPGSRSGALAIAAAGHPELDTRVVIDERSAAFHGLGVSRASGRPVAVVATSGTAPANFFPAVVEADMSCVPLLVVSADRPGELRGIGANQTIDQVELFGTKVRAYAGIEAPEPDVDGNAGWRRTIAGLVQRSQGPRPGPVHLNVAFREPTVPVGDDGRTKSPPYPFATPRIEAPQSLVPEQLTVEPALVTPDRTLVIAGDGEYDREALMVETARLGWPVLATALSGLRGEKVVGSYHLMLARGVPRELVPEAVIAIGAIGPDPVLEELFATADHRVRIDAWGRSIDPGRNSTARYVTDPVQMIAGVASGAEPSWSGAWLETDAASREKVSAALSSETRMTGAKIAVALNDIDWGALVVASSLPIREVDAHLRRSGPIHANRGASGIDGFVSTSLGVASVLPRTLALAGDLSFLHDGNGFVHDGEVDLTMVVVDNSGGGLFDSLPQARFAPDYERLFVTDPHRDLGELARFHGARVGEADSSETLVRLVGGALDRPGLDVIIVRVDRTDDLEVRAQLGG